MQFAIVPRLQWIKASSIPGIGGDALFAPFPHVNALLDKFMALPAVNEYYSGITATCTVGPLGKPCAGAGSDSGAGCTGTISLEQLDAANCKITYELTGGGTGRARVSCPREG